MYGIVLAADGRVVKYRYFIRHRRRQCVTWLTAQAKEHPGADVLIVSARQALEIVQAAPHDDEPPEPPEPTGYQI